MSDRAPRWAIWTTAALSVIAVALAVWMVLIVARLGPNGAAP